ncbi:snare domain protein [Ichthyophthirius multifiliis]|uniref:Snare domain protein n=1 Tax=Ichthyophthirius multifiliis TaxID=5932 RepID=G0QPF5_ICHMU|nr:snare domain protein [Ichthyophthirius multifiliis]EGR32897.1 snare domain protein [Ichthyophthirius multifiliis]|eukprot:XP_004036883.1 snare domain protein [Ichthyophthirius multifiliis]
MFQLKAVQNEIKHCLNKTQNIHSEYKKAANEKIKRQVQILNPNITETEQRQILEDPQGMDKLMMKQMMGQSSVQLQYAYQDIKEKYEGIKKLEQSYQQVFQMLNDIAVLVKTQGDMIDDIEINLKNTQNYVKKANKNLEVMKKEHNKGRKKLCCIIFLGLGLLGLILTPFIMKAT